MFPVSGSKISEHGGGLSRMDIPTMNVPNVPKTKIEVASRNLGTIRNRDVQKYTTSDRLAKMMPSMNISEA